MWIFECIFFDLAYYSLLFSFPGDFNPFNWLFSLLFFWLSYRFTILLAFQAMFKWGSRPAFESIFYLLFLLFDFVPFLFVSLFVCSYVVKYSSMTFDIFFAWFGDKHLWMLLFFDEKPDFEPFEKFLLFLGESSEGE